MKIDKRILCTISAVMLVGCLAYTGSLSYLQKMDEQTNKYTVGNNRSKIVDNFEKPQNLNADAKIKKKVQVQNLGSVPCYVRVLVIPSSNPDAFRLETNGKVDSDLNGSASWYHTGDYDDYYYYKKPLASNEVTSALCDEVTVLKDLNHLGGEDAQIIVYEESTQSEGFDNCLKAFE